MTLIFFAPRLQRLLLPLVGIVFLLIAYVLPSLYQRAYVHNRTHQAQQSIQTLVSYYQKIALQFPTLWPYHTKALTVGVQNWPMHEFYVQIDSAHQNNIWHIGNTQIKRLDYKIHMIRTLKSKGKAIAHLHLMLPVYQQVRDRDFIWGLAFACGLLVALSLFYIPIHLAKKSDQSHLELWEEIQLLHQSLEDRIQHRTLALDELNQKLLRVQEDERNRISRNLHDDLGQTLTALRIHNTLAHQQSPNNSMIHKSIEQIDYAVEQVRTLAHTLRPASIDQLPIKLILAEHLESRCTPLNLQFSCTVVLTQEPTIAQKELWFRVTQEALTNIIRHTQTQAITLLLFDIQTLQEPLANELNLLPVHLSRSIMLQSLIKREKTYIFIMYDDDPSLAMDTTVTFGTGLMGMLARIQEQEGIGKIQKLHEDLGLHIQVYL